MRYDYSEIECSCDGCHYQDTGSECAVLEAQWHDVRGLLQRVADHFVSTDSPLGRDVRAFLEAVR